ncbi:MAG: NADH-quinone oxidoreductase subunit J [Sandaracinaceae bacterium]|nr:NADH-quinone oxidoreductase subunit J [Sandaracinaceae bacterium]
MITTIGFGLLAALLVGSALYVVRATNLVHSVLGLGVTLSITALLYALLEANFVAGVQVLLYVGGVVTLMIFGVMVTRRHDGIVVRSDSANEVRGLLGGGGIFVLLALSILESDLPSSPVGPAPSTASLASELLGPHVVAFEALSMLLLAAIVGAIVIARRRDFGEPRQDLVTRARAAREALRVEALRAEAEAPSPEPAASDAAEPPRADEALPSTDGSVPAQEASS